jgi:hypothetical protein
MATLMELAEKVSNLRADKAHFDDKVTALEEQIRETEALIASAMAEQGMGDGDSFKGGGFRFTIREKMVASYEPDKWDSILAASLAGGRLDLVQRRLNNSVALEMLMDGTAPDGLKAVPIKSLEVRKA